MYKDNKIIRDRQTNLNALLEKKEPGALITIINESNTEVAEKEKGFK